MIFELLNDLEVLLDILRAPKLCIGVGLDARRDVPHDPHLLPL